MKKEEVAAEAARRIASGEPDWYVAHLVEYPAGYADEFPAHLRDDLYCQALSTTQYTEPRGCTAHYRTLAEWAVAA